jgi:hypothetical protein
MVRTLSTYPGGVAEVAGARVRVLVLTLLGLALLAGLAALTRTLVAQAQDQAQAPPGTTTPDLCDQYDVLVVYLEDDAPFATQAGNSAARRLSAIAERYDERSAVEQAGGDIRTVMESVAWEVSDLLTATRPIALECGWDWPVGTTPPAATPRPPAS